MTAGRQVLGIGMGLALLLGLLAAALPGAHFGDAPVVPAPTPEAPRSIGGAGLTWPVPPIGIFTFIMLAGVAVALLSRAVRREVYGRLATGLFVIAIVAAAIPLAVPLEGRILTGSPGGVPESPAAGPARARPEAILELPPAAAASLAGLALVVTAMAVAGAGLRGRRRRRATGAEETRSPAPPVAEAPPPAPDAMVPGTVPLCWTQMARLLSRRSGVALGPSVTPREFCRRLESRGFREPAIQRLTGLFEQVRYGAADDESRREEAAAAFASLEAMYGEPAAGPDRRAEAGSEPAPARSPPS
ncbi:MAG TPA: DUF4129 domain-containing protein [Bacillota bacterium]|nr:DUF4129 domain-containing protein [Bacillota bacterium]